MKTINNSHEFLESFRRGSEFFEPLLETTHEPLSPRMQAIADRIERLEARVDVRLIETRAPEPMVTWETTDQFLESFR